MLEHDYGIAMIDARGHGLSDGVASGFCQALLTHDIAEVIQGFGLGTARMLRLSQGGATGVHLADEHPELGESPIVTGYGTGYRAVADSTQNEGHLAWLEWWTSWLKQLKMENQAEPMVSALSQLSPGAPLPPEHEYVAWVENGVRLDLDLIAFGVSLRSTVAKRGRAIGEALLRVGCPVPPMRSECFPHRDAPPSVKQKPSEQPNVAVLRLAGTGRLIHAERFDWFISIVQAFLAREGALVPA